MGGKRLTQDANSVIDLSSRSSEPKGPRDLLLVIHHGFVSIRRFRRLGIVHGAHGHRESALPPRSSCGTRSLLPADVNNREYDEGQENESVEAHDTEHDWNKGVESVQGGLRSRNAIRRGAHGPR
jgi:hypothetical protein